MFTETQKAQIQQKGIAVTTVEKQLQALATGFPAIRLVKPCTPGDGLVQLNATQANSCLETFEQAQDDGRVLKFVPASGAASRMFKALSYAKAELENESFDELHGKKDSDETLKDFFTFLGNLEAFAFYPELDVLCQKKINASVKNLVTQGRVKEVLEVILGEDGLDFANKPKGLIPFHRYDESARTAFQEHLIEAVQFTKSKEGCVQVHFTIPEAYQSEIETNLASLQEQYAEQGIKYLITYSSQKGSTDTVASTLEGEPFVQGDGSLLFRPGGHGALLENLADIKGDIVFVKNIDNIVPDRLKDEVSHYKKVIGGYLIELQTKAFEYLKILDADPAAPILKEALAFLESSLEIKTPEAIKNASEDEQCQYIVSKLRRPIRVCGMVKNEGEPGGGPFWVQSKDGQLSKQIIESAQVDMTDSEQEKVWKSSTHFNPVDLVCGVRDEKGTSYDLNAFVDPETGFVSEKSQDGRKLKALELPGLWNGAMANWSTVFVEVPVTTFNPVKTVLDLLREQHQ